MRRVVLVVLTLLALCAAPAGAARPGTPEYCAARLNCGLAQIDTMSMSERLRFVRLLSAGPAADLLPGIDPGRWRNIEGIIAMFRDHGLGAPGSWVSYTDAGILEGLQRGIGLAAGREVGTGGNPGSARWASYLNRLAAGELDSRAEHDRAWSEAEQAATEHGKNVAERVHREYPTAAQARFFANSEVYRYLLRNRLPLVDLLPAIQPNCGVRAQHLYDWATDVTNAAAGRTGAELLWSLAELRAVDLLTDAGEVQTAYLTELCAAYQRAAEPRPADRPANSQATPVSTD